MQWCGETERDVSQWEWSVHRRPARRGYGRKEAGLFKKRDAFKKFYQLDT